MQIARIEAERIFFEDAVDSVVAASCERLTGVLSTSAAAHPHDEIHDDVLEEIGRTLGELADPLGLDLIANLLIRFLEALFRRSTLGGAGFGPVCFVGILPMPLAVLTLNLWHDQGPWLARAERIRAWLDRLDPDVIGFQEALRGPGLDQVAELLGSRLPHRDYGRAASFERDGARLDFGNAIASRWPIVGREEQPLPDRGDAETRAALHVDIEAPFGRLAVTCTHLHWRFHHGDTRLRQVRALAERVIARRPRGGFPPVVVGDFNAEPDWDEIRFLTGGHAIDGKTVYFHDAWRVAGGGADPAEPGEPSGCTWSNRNPYARLALEPSRRIDYVFTGYPTVEGLGLVERCEVVCNEAADGVWPSDHFGVLATLRTEPLPESVRSPVW